LNDERPPITGLSRPECTHPARVRKGYAFVIILVHGLALLALLPWTFSWLGVTAALVGHFFFGMLGMTLGYHRLLTHRGFTCSKWLERSLAVLGVCCLQDTPVRWVAVHRKHHQHSDEQPDPHSPRVTFLWGHLGWLMVANPENDSTMFLDRYARDLLTERFYRRLERRWVALAIYGGHAAIFFLAGFLAHFVLAWFGAQSIGPVHATDIAQAAQLGVSLVIWGVFVRTVLVWHVTWAVNSLSHVSGYRSYPTSDDSRNNWLVAMAAHGEGWHNNHHAEPRSASHGHRFWEFDLTWVVVRGLEMVGLVHDVVRPRCWSADSAPLSSTPVSTPTPTPTAAAASEKR